MDMAEAGEVESWPYALKHMVRRFTHVRVRVKGFGVLRVWGSCFRDGA